LVNGAIDTADHKIVQFQSWISRWIQIYSMCKKDLPRGSVSQEKLFDKKTQRWHRSLKQLQLFPVSL
jgi:hypothetical protein